ncbi:hypothetical protein DSO57_1036602 [Entomophthora muscae]|uniref:Uncharacterized protein n=1 Tax=Entomophthora muscae TaxID=34485 RepID=A0ACC2SNM3_9FUNG|nr:hypothetical protein DSO57_1036602 [Entomophthora muscae]
MCNGTQALVLDRSTSAVGSARSDGLFTPHFASQGLLGASIRSVLQTLEAFLCLADVNPWALRYSIHGHLLTGLHRPGDSFTKGDAGDGYPYPKKTRSGLRELTLSYWRAISTRESTRPEEPYLLRGYLPPVARDG